MFTCTAVCEHDSLQLYRNSFLLDSNFLQKSNSLLLVIKQGNDLQILSKTWMYERMFQMDTQTHPPT